MRLALLPLLILGCSAPTLQQRQEQWYRFQGVTKATCLVGASGDVAMPADIREWCKKVSD